MIAVPSATPVTTPAETVAMDVEELDQTAVEVRSAVVPSEYVPVATI
jgi:hypothetical protein